MKNRRQTTDDGRRKEPAGKWVIACAILLALSSVVCRLSSVLAQSTTGPHLSITTLELTNYIVQPISGRWDAATRLLQPSGVAQSGIIQMYCGTTIAVYWQSQTGKLYECQASDTPGTWLGSPLQIIGTGGVVTQYDVPHPHRLYRVKTTDQ